jgi:hypothetical protein
MAGVFGISCRDGESAPNCRRFEQELAEEAEKKSNWGENLDTSSRNETADEEILCFLLLKKI